MTISVPFAMQDEFGVGVVRATPVRQGTKRVRGSGSAQEVVVTSGIKGAHNAQSAITFKGERQNVLAVARGRGALVDFPLTNPDQCAIGARQPLVCFIDDPGVATCSSKLANLPVTSTANGRRISERFKVVGVSVGDVPGPASADNSLAGGTDSTRITWLAKGVASIVHHGSDPIPAHAPVFLTWPKKVQRPDGTIGPKVLEKGLDKGTYPFATVARTRQSIAAIFSHINERVQVWMAGTDKAEFNDEEKARAGFLARLHKDLREVIAEHSPETSFLLEGYRVYTHPLVRWAHLALAVSGYHNLLWSSSVPELRIFYDDPSQMDQSSRRELDGKARDVSAGLASIGSLFHDVEPTEMADFLNAGPEIMTSFSQLLNDMFLGTSLEPAAPGRTFAILLGTSPFC